MASMVHSVEWRKKFPDDRPEAVKDFENMIHAYWGTVLSVDDSVGRLVEHLESTGQLQNTVIVFMGDNGLLEGEHGMVDKRTMHEPSIRIPIIACGPGLPVGKVVAVANSDNGYCSQSDAALWCSAAGKDSGTIMGAAGE
jgi:arylsulfatase A-like enzyme